LTAEQQQTWSTAPLPAPDGTPFPGVSLAGGSSLVIARTSRKQAAAQKLIQFLSRPDVQVRFWELSNDLPARRSAWLAPKLVQDREIAAFRTQLDRTVALPRIPEAENVVITLSEHGQLLARGRYRDAHAAAMALDAKVEGMLEKRRWVLEKSRAADARAGLRVASSRLPVAGCQRIPGDRQGPLATGNRQPATSPRNRHAATAPPKH